MRARESGLAAETGSAMNKLILANLLHRPVRSIISILAVAIEVVMILSIVGIFMGMLNDQKARTNGIGADLLLRPSNASYMNGVGGAPMPIKNIEAIRRLPHVAAASPVIQNLSTAGKVEVLYGIEYQSFNSLKPFVFLSGSPFQGPYDVIVDDVFAGSDGGYHVGDSIPIMKQNFRISGIVEHGKGGRKLVPIETMGTMMGADGKSSVFYIKCDNSANADAVMAEIHGTRGLEDTQIQTMDEWLSMMTPEKLPGFNISLNVVTGIAVVVGFLVIFQSMYTAVLERTREIGILKSMGASKVTIVSMVLRESGLMALAGVAVGMLGAVGIRILLAHAFPTLSVEIPGVWLVRGALIAFAGAILGALYPAWIAARKDPIDALAYE